MPIFTPTVSILPEPQLALWPELSATPTDFVLYGGTALALRLGHRPSVDFDFFTAEPFDPYELRTSIAYLGDAVTIQEQPNTLTCRVERLGQSVLLSFFAVPALRQIKVPDLAEGPRIKVASMIDVAGMKAAVVPRRIEPKDYIDIHQIISSTKITLVDALVAGGLIYGPSYSPLLTLKALTDYSEEALAGLPSQLQSDLVQAVAEVDVQKLSDLMGAQSAQKIGQMEGK